MSLGFNVREKEERRDKNRASIEETTLGVVVHVAQQPYFLMQCRINAKGQLIGQSMP